ncbi:MAG TPA: hypothetical protein EYP41_16900 [Anaerolineae bacterium]|nr:hypothetical protein [Anaerolineae bacterium]HIP72388.1 hypothetical protein [Anaerolineae bacterium]
MNTQPKSTRVRLHSHITQSRFLHVEEALNVGWGKLRLFAGRYKRSEGMKAYVFHFLDLPDARVIFDALARGEQGFRYKEYKGTPPRDGHPAVSRALSIAVKGENVYIELKTGPGKLTNTGAITPNGPAKVEVNVSFKLYEARRMAASVLAYIHAWDVMRMMVNQHLVSQPSPYLVVSATSEANGISTAPANGISKPNGTVTLPADVANNGRPVTCKTSQPAAEAKTPPITNGRSRNGYAKQNDNNSPQQLLFYGDGTPVSADNQTERTTYARYRQAKGAVPPSKSALLQYYQQQTAV